MARSQSGLSVQVRTARHQVAHTDVLQYRKITLPEFGSRGRLMFAEESRHVPFGIKRIFAIYDVPADGMRGRHAHRAQEQFIIMLSGMCKLTVDDGLTRAEESLSRPTEGIYIPAGLWLELSEFAQGSVCLVLASGPYDEHDYIRDYAEFKRFRRC